MSENDKTIDEAVEAILSLKKNYRSRVPDEGRDPMAVLVGVDWKHHVKSTFFGVKDTGNRVTCELLSTGKIWVLKVENGHSIVDHTNLREGESISLRENSTVTVGNLKFRFIPLPRIERFHKSYKKIIIEAIKSSTNNKLSLAEIYQYFEKNYGFSTEDSATWKNSIRHNLSINNMFQRVPRGEGDFSLKGMLWTVVDNRNNKRRTIDFVDYKNLEHCRSGKETGTRSSLLESEKFQTIPGNGKVVLFRKRRISEDEYPNKKFKQTIIPRVTGYVSIPVSYSFECLLNPPHKLSETTECDTLPDISYEIPDFSSEHSSEMFSYSDNSDRKVFETTNSHNFDMENHNKKENQINKLGRRKKRHPPPGN